MSINKDNTQIYLQEIARIYHSDPGTPVSCKTASDIIEVGEGCFDGEKGEKGEKGQLET